MASMGALGAYVSRFDNDVDPQMEKEKCDEVQDTAWGGRSGRPSGSGGGKGTTL